MTSTELRYRLDIREEQAPWPLELEALLRGIVGIHAVRVDAGAATQESTLVFTDRMDLDPSPQTAIIVDLKVEKAGLDVKVERLRTFAPVWSNVDDGYGLYVGTAWIGLIDSRGYGWARIGPYPEICYQPGTLPHSVAEAARAVCSRLGIPDVGVEGV
jgi:hypothetical protein